MKTAQNGVEIGGFDRADQTHSNPFQTQSHADPGGVGSCLAGTGVALACPACYQLLHTATMSKRSSVTWRSVGIGTALVAFTAALAPFNDYVVGNSLMIHGYFPPVVNLALLLLAIVVNAPLLKWRPSSALTAGELAVVAAMLLVAASVPTTGVMRLFIPTLVYPFHEAQTNSAFQAAFDAMHLPDWLFPPGGSTDRANMDLVTTFFARLRPGESVPYGAWIVPLAGWGVFFVGMFVAMLCLAVIVRRQWSENEHLEFPLAKLQLSLIEPPAPGRAFNALFSAKSFWIALAIVFGVHAINGAALYFPKSVPAIPLKYELGSVMSEAPLSYMGAHVKSASIYFVIIGISYFIPLRASLSIWAIVLIESVLSAANQSVGGNEISDAQWGDQLLGGMVVFTIGLLFIARHDWARVIGNALGIRADRTTTRFFCSDRVAVSGIAIGILIMTVWLLVVGVSPWVAAMIVAFLLMSQFVTARFVAELGLPALKCGVDVVQTNSMLSPGVLSMRDTFFSGAFTLAGPVASREALLPFATHALQIDAQTEEATRGRRWLLSLLAWSLAVSFAVSAVSSLWCYYNYAQPLSDRAGTTLNPAGTDQLPKRYIAEPMVNAAANRQTPATYNRPLAIGIGAAVTGALQLASWRWSAWPLLPVGYLVAPVFQTRLVWFSLFLGWSAKMLIVRFGGHTIYRQARPVFVGMIFGEIVAAAFWLVITLVLAWMHVDYHPIQLLPP